MPLIEPYLELEELNKELQIMNTFPIYIYLFIDEYLYRIKVLQQYLHYKNINTACCNHYVSCLKYSRLKTVKNR